MNEIQQNIGAWLASVIVGSGGTLAIAWWALRGRLSEIFQTREDAAARRAAHEADMAGLRKHVDEEFTKVDRTMEGLDRRVSQNSASHASEKARLDVITERLSGQGGRLDEMHTALQRQETKLDGISAAQARMAEGLNSLGRSIDQLRDELRGRP